MGKTVRLLLSLLVIVATFTLGFEVPVHAAKVKLSKKSITLEVGQKKTIKVKGTTKKVAWSSSDKNIATVSSKGKITAKGEGTCKITAKVGSKKLTCKVTVKHTTEAPTSTPKPESDLDKMIYDNLDGYISNGVFDIHAYGSSIGAGGEYIFTTSFAYYFYDGWFIQTGAWADWAREAGVDPTMSYISIGRFEDGDNYTTYSCIFDSGEMMPCFKDHADGNIQISKKCLAYLAQTVAAVKNNNLDTSIAPNVPGLDFRPCAKNAYIQY